MAGDLVVIGRVSRPHGIRGEIRVRLFTETAASFNRFERVFVRRPGGKPELIVVVEARPHKNIVLLKFKGLRSRDEALELTGADICVRRDWLPGLEDNEYYWADLIGLDVFDERGEFLGRVENILPTGADDILALSHHGREILLPFRAEIILDVDLIGKRVLARPPEGLADL
ncbi:MAG: ribosome maturation factor RimM [Thermodesulfobacteriota bacterium]|nr:ribosome maturation factor RimM [Thermodesulfobacteriota bacterium]